MTASAEHSTPPAGRHLLWPAPGASIPAALLPDSCLTHEPIAWSPGSTAGHWQARVPLGELPAGALCVPSVLLADDAVTAHALRFTWAHGGEVPLAPIRVDPEAEAPGPRARVGAVETAGGRVIGGLDCIETATAVRDPELHLVVTTDAAAPEPPRVGLLAGTRPRHLEVTDDGSTAAALDVPALSQMTHTPAIARHVCSPVSVAMVLGHLGLDADPRAFVRSAEHPDHERLFGMWPLNLARAWRLGAAGLVRIFTRPAEAAAVLEAGHPIVTSIRFEAGALPGAPLPRTGGHLVVLRGMESDSVSVNDPAAPDDQQVSRRYDRGAFLAAWLADRGVGYVLWPRSDR